MSGIAYKCIKPYIFNSAGYSYRFDLVTISESIFSDCRNACRNNIFFSASRTIHNSSVCLAKHTVYRFIISAITIYINFFKCKRFCKQHYVEFHIEFMCNFVGISVFILFLSIVAIFYDMACTCFQSCRKSYFCEFAITAENLFP